jgi:hypothetical protein
MLLAFLDPAAGLSFLQRAQADFERAGDEEQAAACDYTFATLALVASSGRGRVWLADRYLGRAAQRLAGRSMRPEVRGLPAFVEGLYALRAGRWQESQRALTGMLVSLTGSEGTTERLMACETPLGPGDEW